MYIYIDYSQNCYIYIMYRPKMCVYFEVACTILIHAYAVNKWNVRFPDTMVGRVSMMHIFFKELISNRGIAEVGGCCEKCQELRST